MTDARKALVSIVAALVVVGMVIVLVLAFAVIPLPDFPRLANDPDPSIPGTVAFARWEEGGTCVMTVPASGGDPREVYCEDNGGFGEFSPGWTPDGLLIVEEFGPRGEAFVLVNPDTGEVVDRVDFRMDEDGLPGRDMVVYEDGPNVFIDGRRGSARLILENATGAERILLEAEGPADYWLDWARLSPDREWVLVQDSEGRLLVVAADGDPNTRILAEDVEGWMAAAWYIPGYDEWTWDPRG